MKISLIATVLNEGESIRRLMDSILEQRRQPDEIVIVDGGSHDNTVEIIRSYADRLPLRVVVEPGCNISQGRNRAIAAATGDIIAVTDAGVRLDPAWLENLAQPFTNVSVDVACGFFQADPHTIFEAAMGATVLPLRDEIDPATFLPSSRSVAFRKTAWEAVAGYPEWLDYCEDLIFDLRLKLAQARFVFVPDALVYFQPRTSLRAFYRQYYHYARGDGKADLWRKRHAARYLTYLVAVPGVLLLGWLVHPLLWLLYIPGAVFYFAQPYRRLPTILMYITPVSSVGAQGLAPLPKPPLNIFEIFYAIALVPVIRVAGDVAKMIGYPVGLRWRIVNHPSDWRDINASVQHQELDTP